MHPPPFLIISNMAKQQKKVYVLQMVDTFLYLPLYYAIDHNFFGFLDNDKFIYEVQTKMAWGQTDRNVFDMLTQRIASSSSEIYFAIGDPRSLADKRQDPKSLNIALIGALITGTAFWAVNHGQGTTSTVTDLCKFKGIVSFEEGSTSYDLAKSIVCDAEDQAPQIIQVKPEQEFAKLRSGGPDQVILTPNVIAVSEFLQDNSAYSVEISIGSHYEFSDLLLTSIAVKSQVILDDPFLVSGFLKGIQHAMNSVHSKSDHLVNYACKTFKSDRLTIEKALQLSFDSRVFPQSIKVNEALWMRALSGYLRSDGVPVTNDDIRYFKDVYSVVGAQYESFVSASVHSVIHPVLNGTPKRVHPFVFSYDVLGLAYLYLALGISLFAFKTNLLGLLVVLVVSFIMYFVGQHIVLVRSAGKLVPRITYWALAILVFHTLWHQLHSKDLRLTQDLIIPSIFILIPYLGKQAYAAIRQNKDI
jgi:hypothetical protein